VTAEVTQNGSQCRFDEYTQENEMSHNSWQP
jgi:hypothetical protein